MTSVISGVRHEAPPLEGGPTAGVTMDEVAAALASSGLATKNGVEFGVSEAGLLTGLPPINGEAAANARTQTAALNTSPVRPPKAVPEAVTPVDDRFKKSDWEGSTAAQRLADVARRGGLQESESVLMSTWQARRIRKAASGLGHVVARNSMLRNAGLL